MLSLKRSYYIPTLKRDTQNMFCLFYIQYLSHWVVITCKAMQIIVINNFASTAFRTQWFQFVSTVLACLHTPHPRLSFNTLRPRQNGRHFPVNIFKCTFVNENMWILIKMLLKYVPKIPIINGPAVFQIMAWHRPTYKMLHTFDSIHRRS